MFDKFKPLADRVLIKRTESQEKTATGIYLPDSAKEKGQEGTVIAVGPGKADKNGQLIQPAVKVGDKVYFGKYAGTEIGPDQIVIREEEILGIIEN